MGLADRQAELTAVLLRGGAAKYSPIDVEERVAAFEKALATDEGTDDHGSAADQWAQAWMSQTVTSEQEAA